MEVMGILFLILYIIILLPYTVLYKLFICDVKMKRKLLFACRTGTYYSLVFTVISIYTIISSIFITTQPTVICIIHIIVFASISISTSIFPPTYSVKGSVILSGSYGAVSSGGIIGLLLPVFE